jgi:hypothetical protein
MSISSPFRQSVIMNGPDPSGLFEVSSAFAFLNTFSGRMLLENSDTSDKNGAHGSFSVITSVWSSVAAMPCTASSAHCHGPSTS